MLEVLNGNDTDSPHDANAIDLRDMLAVGVTDFRRRSCRHGLTSGVGGVRQGCLSPSEERCWVLG